LSGIINRVFYFLTCVNDASRHRKSISFPDCVSQSCLLRSLFVIIGVFHYYCSIIMFIIAIIYFLVDPSCWASGYIVQSLIILPLLALSSYLAYKIKQADGWESWALVWPADLGSNRAVENAFIEISTQCSAEVAFLGINQQRTLIGRISALISSPSITIMLYNGAWYKSCYTDPKKIIYSFFFMNFVTLILYVYLPIKYSIC